MVHGNAQLAACMDTVFNVKVNRLNVIFRQFKHIVLGSAVLLEPGAGVGTL